MNYLFPMAIEYGMSADEFWKDDPQLFVSYRTSFINKKKREMEEEDYKSWLRGLYIYDGNSKLNAELRLQLGNMFAKVPVKKEIGTYTPKPYSELEKEKNKPMDRNKNYQNYQDSLVYFGSLKQIYLERNNLQKKKGE